MNVTELARRLQMPTKDLLDIMPRLGFAVGRRAIKIDDRLVDRIVEAVNKDRRRQEQTSRAAGVKELSLAEQEKKQGEESRRSQPLAIEPVIIVRDLATRMNLPVAKVIGELMRNGVMANINERIDYETAAIIAEDLGFKPQPATKASEQPAELASRSNMRQGQADEPVRPPVVVVMGHVDHGKTSLLDALRKTNVAQQESGNITQRLGAYQVIVPLETGQASSAEPGTQTSQPSSLDNSASPRSRSGGAEGKPRGDDTPAGRVVTFLDTPGHEAFAAMRSRGGRAADVAILVVAADDGVQPQTIEALQIIQQEKIPFVVAINKIDKPEANIDRVKQQLAELNVATEDYGGRAVAVPVSAKSNQGLQELLETVLLVSDLEPPRAAITGPAAGFIIESHIDKGEGPVATVLVQRGTLRPNDWVLIGEVVGKIRQLKDEFGHNLPAAGPSKPVKILGLKSLAKAGDILNVTTDKKLIQEKLKSGRKAATSATLSLATAVKNKDQDNEEIKRPELRLVVKAGTLGSLEALLDVINRFNSQMVGLKVVKQGLGYVNDADVLAAKAGEAVVVAYHTTISASAEALARDHGVDLLHNEVIYKLLDELQSRLLALIPPEVLRRQLGSLQVLAIFKVQGKDQVVGGRVQAGVVKAGTKVKLIRGPKVLAYGELVNLQSGKQDVTEVAAGNEAGLRVKLDESLRVGDLLEVFQEEVNRRQLDVQLR